MPSQQNVKIAENVLKRNVISLFRNGEDIKCHFIQGHQLDPLYLFIYFRLFDISVKIYFQLTVADPLPTNILLYFQPLIHD